MIATLLWPSRVETTFNWTPALGSVLASKCRKLWSLWLAPVRVNLTDGHSELMKGRNGVVAGYNAQSVVSPLNSALGNGMLITPADVVNNGGVEQPLVMIIVCIGRR